MSTPSGPPSGVGSSTSQSLLQRAKANDPAAWHRLSKIYGPDVYRWARQSGVQSSDARDIVQEVFRAVARTIGDFRKEKPGHAFRGWLWTITKNKVRDHFRSQSLRPAAEGGTEAQRKLQELPEAVPDSSDEATSSKVTGSLAHRAITLMQTDFEEQTWQAFWKTVVEERSPADVAAELGMSLSAVYQAKSRVLRRLRQELNGLDLAD
jgi:RNA polymerase sigma-70 factor (ECF subfamily)